VMLFLRSYGLLVGDLAPGRTLSAPAPAHARAPH
jgi:hypothetical protein